MGAVLAIEPIAMAFVAALPSTTTEIADAVLTHCTVCQRPSLIDAVENTSPYLLPLKPHDGAPLGWYSILNSPPGVVYWPLRMRSQSGVFGALVALTRMVTLRFAAPALRSFLVGTVTCALPAKL